PGAGRGDVRALRDAGRGDPHRRSRPRAAAARDRRGCDRLRRGACVNAVDPGFEELLAFVRDARAFDYTGYRRPTLMRRFQQRMEEVGASTWAGDRESRAKSPTGW